MEVSHKALDYRLIIDRKNIDTHILKGYEITRSHTESYEAKNAQIPKRLRSKDAHKYTKIIQAEHSYTQGYEAKKLAHIPKTATKQRCLHTTTATRRPTSIQSTRHRKYSTKIQNNRSTRKVGESEPHHFPRLRKLHTMAISHPERAQTEELYLGSYRKSETNERDRKSRYYSHGLCTNRHNNLSTLDCLSHQTQGVSSLPK